MSFSIGLSGHGIDPDDVQEIFENSVRALRSVQADGSAPIGGAMAATDAQSQNAIVIAANDVVDVTEPGDAEIEGDEMDAPEPDATEDDTADQPEP